MNHFVIQYGDLLVKLLLAVLLGGAVGLERTVSGKQAGMRTYALVTLGACLFTLISEQMRPLFSVYDGYNPIFMVSQVVVGIGFLGAGLIIFQGQNIHGLTSAAGLWVMAGVGIAIGFGLYQLALLAALLIILIFSGLWRVEHFISPDTMPIPEAELKDRKFDD